MAATAAAVESAAEVGMTGSFGLTELMFASTS